MTQYTAQGINLLFFASATLASSLLSYRVGRLSLRRLLPLLAYGSLGALLGSLATAWVPSELSRVAVGLFMLFGGGYTLVGRLLRIYRTKTQKKKGEEGEIP